MEEGVREEVGPINHFLQTPAIFHIKIFSKRSDIGGRRILKKKLNISTSPRI